MRCVFVYLTGGGELGDLGPEGCSSLGGEEGAKGAAAGIALAFCDELGKLEVDELDENAVEAEFEFCASGEGEKKL